MLVVLVFFIILLSLYLGTRLKYKSSIGRGLLLWLAFSLLCTFILSIFLTSYNNIGFFATLYYVLIFLIWIVPFLNVKMKQRLVEQVGRRDYLFSIIMIIIILPSTLFYLPQVVNVFSGDASSMLDVRLAVNHTVVDENRGFSINNVFIAGAQLYVIPLYLFFLSLTQKWNKYVSFFLLISSFSFPLYCLSRLGRDGIVYWGINALLFYSLFKDFYIKKTRQRLLNAILLLSSVSVLFMLTISIVRFTANTASDSSSFIEGTFGYIGQSVRNFSRFFGAETDYTVTMFPGVKTLLGMKVGSTAAVLNANGLWDLSRSFSSFVLSMVLSYGYIGTIVFSAIIAYVVHRLKNYTYSKKSIYGMMSLMVIMQVPMNGVFYYRQSIGNGDLYLLLSIAMLLIFPKLVKKVS